MSLVLAGRRRIYMLLLFREELMARISGPQALRRTARALSADYPRGAGAAEGRGARLLISARIHRRWGHYVFGLSFFVLTYDGSEPSVPAPRRRTEKMQAV